MNHVITHLQQHLPAVHAHGVHGAEGHEGDGDGRRGVHRVIVTAQQAHKIVWLTDIINSTDANMEAEAHSLDIRYSVVSSPDFDEHVGDAQSEGSGEVDQHKRVHSGQENAAQRRDESTQTAHTHTDTSVHHRSHCLSHIWGVTEWDARLTFGSDRPRAPEASWCSQLQTETQNTVT